MNLHVISRLFRSFAERECSGTSPLYKYLSLQIAEDEELLKLAAQAHVGQPIPNLFFGSVHYLLLKGRTCCKTHNGCIKARKKSTCLGNHIQ